MAPIWARALICGPLCWRFALSVFVVQVPGLPLLVTVAVMGSSSSTFDEYEQSTPGTVVLDAADKQGTKHNNIHSNLDIMSGRNAKRLA